MQRDSNTPDNLCQGSWKVMELTPNCTGDHHSPWAVYTGYKDKTFLDLHLPMILKWTHTNDSNLCPFVVPMIEMHNLLSMRHYIRIIAFQNYQT